MSYVTGNLPGRPGSLERDGIQPKVVATSPGLFPRVSVDFLDNENKDMSEQEVSNSMSAVCWFCVGAAPKHVPTALLVPRMARSMVPCPSWGPPQLWDQWRWP